MSDMVPESVEKYVYHEEPDIVLLKGDCLEILPLLESNSVDLVLTDPPYGVTSLAWDKIIDNYLSLSLPLIKNSGSLWSFGSLKYLLEIDFTGWKYAQDVIWMKHNGSNFHNDRFRRLHEIIIQLYPSSNKWGQIFKEPQFTYDAVAKTVRKNNRPPHLGISKPVGYKSEQGGPRLMTSAFKVRSCHGYAEHPTQKPIDAITPLVKYSCPAEGIILDPFLGSGTTAVVAKQLGRKCIGIEIEQKYLDIAIERLRQEVLF